VDFDRLTKDKKMSELKDQLEAIYKDNFIGEMLTSIDIQMIQDEYLEYDTGKVWLTEGGIELKTEDKVVSFTYESEPEIRFTAVESDLLPFIADYDYYGIEPESEAFYSVFEEKITDLQINWIKLLETDYKGDILDEEEYPVGFIFTFENGSTLQIASVDTAISAETLEFTKINYTLEGSILISFNRIFDIGYIH
jgi:hypothetical protein